MRHGAIVLAAALLLAGGCGNRPRMGGSRASGQSRLMDQTFAGQNACNPDDHLRPFIIEWDATDMSSFESHAANDVVFVRYEGCKLVVLDECRNESIRGSQGSYRPPEWTSGSLETINISNEGELYAKLPLGSATLGGRVSGGEKFHMEYYVAGKREATRDAVYRTELASTPGCERATHFVHGYNLGAFALGSANELNTSVGGSVYGFGVGGSTSKKNSAEKKGGDLGVCRSDSATEVEGCKAPIRLSLRKIRDGENPDNEGMTGEMSDASLNALGKINQNIETSKKAGARLQSAQAKMNAGDGKGCLAELDRVAKLDPKLNSQDPKSGLAMARAQCLMMAGKCDPGKRLYRKAFEQSPSGSWTPERIDTQIETLAQQHCQGQLTDRERLLKAYTELADGANNKKSAKVCDDRWSELQRLAPKVKPKNFDDTQIKSARDVERNVGLYHACLARAGACDRLFKLYSTQMLSGLKPSDKKYWQDNPDKLRANFEQAHPRCGT